MAAASDRGFSLEKFEGWIFLSHKMRVVVKCLDLGTPSYVLGSDKDLEHEEGVRLWSSSSTIWGLNLIKSD